MSIPAEIQKFINARNKYQSVVYQEIISETQKLFADNPSMTKLKKKIEARIKAIEAYDYAAIMAIKKYYPEIINHIQADTTEQTTSIETIKSHYE